ncbi:MAG: DUF2442 domain-containing protein [Oscillospiraceae bacterium]|nr:DUF2442 domain-containing protein [Oscillospiraceae bacterium]
MSYRASSVEFTDGTTLEVTFQNGIVKKYDMMSLAKKFPQLEALKDRDLFLSGRLVGGVGIVWTDELDISTDTIYECGEEIRQEEISAIAKVGCSLLETRMNAGITQTELAKSAGMDQGDVSKIERGLANPSISTLERLAYAMNRKLNISFD